ncbi:hypothetical protein MMON_00060 [Mycolicibacterium monacense]|uniref:Uncharacterized protein n=1 Tax=Mycolicibacterium monacense TaxID=85693 RepID=A0AAD1MXQ5_MYCMB|nr:hypothetical protein MMON_00060 [Mycolicibacterium monacense]
MITGSVSTGSAGLCPTEQLNCLRPDTVQGQQFLEIRGKISAGAVTGVDERAGGRPADPDTVEYCAAVGGSVMT